MKRIGYQIVGGKEKDTDRCPFYMKIMKKIDSRQRNRVCVRGFHTKSRQRRVYHQHKVLYIIIAKAIQPTADEISLWRDMLVKADDIHAKA